MLTTVLKIYLKLYVKNICHQGRCRNVFVYIINGTAIPVRNMHKPGTTPEAEIKENIFK